MDRAPREANGKLLGERRPSPGHMHSQLPPYLGCHVCMSVCLSTGLFSICGNSNCERKRSVLGDALSPSKTRMFAFAFAIRTGDRQTKGQAHRHTNMTAHIGSKRRSQTSWTGRRFTYFSLRNDIHTLWFIKATL